MNTATGNAILIRLAASAMYDGTINSDAYRKLLVMYNNEYKDMVSAVYEFIRSCGITQVSKKTLKLAEIAIKYFRSEGVEMTDLKELYVECPACCGVMQQVNENNDTNSITYKCVRCEASIIVSQDNISEYVSSEMQARAIFEDLHYEPTEEEEKWYEEELANDRERTEQ